MDRIVDEEGAAAGFIAAKASQQSQVQPIGSGPCSSNTHAAVSAKAAHSDDDTDDELLGAATRGSAADSPRGSGSGSGSKPMLPQALPKKAPGTATAGGRTVKRKLPAPKDLVPCPRCGSDDTKFAYYNNRNMKQPRHYCRACQRHWTAGGILRQVAIGAGRRRPRPTSSDPCSRPTDASASIAAGSHYEQQSSPGIPGVGTPLPQQQALPLQQHAVRFSSVPDLQSMAAAAAAFPAPNPGGPMPTAFYGAGGFGGGQGMAPWLLPPAGSGQPGGAAVITGAMPQPGALFAPPLQSSWPPFGAYGAGMSGGPAFNAWPAPSGMLGQQHPVAAGFGGGAAAAGFAGGLPSGSLPPVSTAFLAGHELWPPHSMMMGQQEGAAHADQAAAEMQQQGQDQLDLQAAAAVWLNGAASPQSIPSLPGNGCSSLDAGSNRQQLPVGALRGGSVNSAGSWLSAGTATLEGLGG